MSAAVGEIYFAQPRRITTIGIRNAHTDEHLMAGHVPVHETEAVGPIPMRIPIAVPARMEAGFEGVIASRGITHENHRRRVVDAGHRVRLLLVVIQAHIGENPLSGGCRIRIAVILNKGGHTVLILAAGYVKRAPPDLALLPISAVTEIGVQGAVGDIQESKTTAASQLTDPCVLMKSNREAVVVIARVQRARQDDLLEIADAGYDPGPALRLAQYRQQHARQDRDNGDYDQQFDQSEGLEKDAFFRAWRTGDAKAWRNNQPAAWR